MTDYPLREFEELVLLSVLISAPEAYGASLQKVLADEAGRDVSIGAIYTALDRLSRKGFVTSELGDPTPVRGGRRKRQYQLTPKGLEHIRDVRRVRNRMWNRVAPELLEGRAAR